MDSKMDSGHLENADELDDDYDPSRQLTPAEVIGVMDQILCLEVRGILKVTRARLRYV